MKPNNWAQVYITPVRTLLAQIKGRSFEEIGYQDTPIWLPRIQEMIIHQAFGRIIDLENKSKSYQMGFLVAWMFVSLIDLRKRFKAVKKAFGKHARSFNKEEEKDWDNMWNESLPTAEREQAAQSVIKDSIKHTVFGDHKTRWDFFDGLNEGRKTVYTSTGQYFQQCDRIQVLLFLWILWPFHEELGNRTQLRDRLIQVFDEQTIGDQKQFNNFLEDNKISGIGQRGRPKIPEN